MADGRVLVIEKEDTVFIDNSCKLLDCFSFFSRTRFLPGQLLRPRNRFFDREREYVHFSLIPFPYIPIQTLKDYNTFSLSNPDIIIYFDIIIYVLPIHLYLTFTNSDVMIIYKIKYIVRNGRG